MNSIFKLQLLLYAIPLFIATFANSLRGLMYMPNFFYILRNEFAGNKLIS